jgi:photosystem II stability/assembly factor-like uncharacterized protein
MLSGKVAVLTAVLCASLTLAAGCTSRLFAQSANSTAISAALVLKRETAKNTQDALMALPDDERTKLFDAVPKVPHARNMEFLHAIQFQGSSLGWALDWHGNLHRTSDGGITWTEKRLPLAKGLLGRFTKWLDLQAPETLAFRSMHFADDRLGLVVGRGGVIQSEDGGASWQWLASPSKIELAAVFCSSTRTCWIAGGEPHAIFQRNSPRSAWVRQSTPAEGGIFAIQFIGESMGWAVSTNGELIGTTDGGKRWNVLFHDSGRRFYGLHFVNELFGWVVGADGIVMRTQDGGRRWVDQELPLPLDYPVKEAKLNAVKFIDAQRGWVAGLHGIIFGTEDGGETWALQRFEGLPMNQLTIYSLAITEGPTVWAAGNTGNIFVSIDNGEFWFPIHGYMAQVVDELGRMLGGRSN